MQEQIEPKENEIQQQKDQMVEVGCILTPWDWQTHKCVLEHNAQKDLENVLIALIRQTQIAKLQRVYFYLYLLLITIKQCVCKSQFVNQTERVPYLSVSSVN